MSNISFSIKFTNHTEIRMGSSYNHCEIVLSGLEKLKLPNSGWQDKYAWENDSKRLVLIKWEIENNEPGFRFYIINTEYCSIQQSHRIPGCINELFVEGYLIKYNKFLFDKTKSTHSILCCHIDEEYQIT